MRDTEDERPMLDDLHPTGKADTATQEGPMGDEHSILGELNGIRDHVQTLEEAARIARAVEFDQLRAVVTQLELVAQAAKDVEGDLARELSDTSRVSVSTARLVRQRLAYALRALSDALAVIGDDRVTTG